MFMLYDQTVFKLMCFHIFVYVRNMVNTLFYTTVA